MFTDIKGYVSLTSSYSRKKINKLIDFQDEVILPIIKEAGGRVIKHIGDAYMIVFESPTSAVLCGVEIQKAVKKHLRLKIGINMGEVTLKKDDIFGEPVNVASRLESIAKPGKVYFTEAVYLAMNKNEVPVKRLGEKNFRGVSHKINVYKVAEPGIWGKLEKVWPVIYPRSLPLLLILLGLSIANWSINKPESFSKNTSAGSDPTQADENKDRVLSATDSSILEDSSDNLETAVTTPSSDDSTIIVSPTPEPAETSPIITSSPTPEQTPSSDPNPDQDLSPGDVIKKIIKGKALGRKLKEIFEKK